MHRKCQRRPAGGAAATYSGNETVAENSLVAAENQAEPLSVTRPEPQVESALSELHIQLLREQLRLRPVPLSTTPQDRWEWSRRGVSLKERDAAAVQLVDADEARYELLKDGRWTRPESDAVVHLVATQGGGQ
jgi:hypothetical protein